MNTIKGLKECIIRNHFVSYTLCVTLDIDMLKIIATNGRRIVESNIRQM